MDQPYSSAAGARTGLFNSYLLVNVYDFICSYITLWTRVMVVQ